jgi:hypothetical protein
VTSVLRLAPVRMPNPGVAVATKRDVEFIGEDKNRQLESLWRETKRESETSYHGRMWRMKRKDYLIFTMLAEMVQTKITKMESRKTTKK